MMTYARAKREIQSLQNYLDLIDHFEIHSIEDFIIHKYAIHNSISKVIKEIRKNDHSSFSNHSEVTPDFVKKVILSKPKNELHSMINRYYKKKIRPQTKRNLIH